MKKLNDILARTPVLEIKGTTERLIEAIAFDSRQVSKDSVFIAVTGTQSDGHKFIPQAINKGAVAIICEKYPDEMPEEICFIKTSSSQKALSMVSAAFYDYPSENIKLIGVTGTNGKTTVVTLLHNLFTSLGYHCGMLSTVHNRIDGEIISATHTTPDPVQINQLLKKMNDTGCSHCFMEVSSHAIHQHRIAGLKFDAAVFTNITHDHLDYHKDFSSYLKAKKMFFDDLSSEAFALVNKDDKNGMVMLQNTKAIKKTYALSSPADFNAKIIENQFEGLMLRIAGEEAWFRLVGKFNAYNLLATYATAVLAGEKSSEVLSVLSSLTGAEGRFELLRSEDNVTAIVDYAHTPDALKNVLSTINDTRSRNEQLITVVGAGGDRDSSKRPVMGRIAAAMSTKVIFTSDNPRSEDPEKIIEDVMAGVEAIDYKKTLSITNRKEAIKAACMMAEPGDIILVAGKGHEKYQEVKGVKHHFDDKEMIEEFLTNRGNR